MSAYSTLIGNITRDPEIKFIGDKGTPCANFSIAVNRGYKNQQTGEWVSQDPHYFDVVAYGALAENIANSFQQGNRVVVYGKAEQQTWEDKDTGKSRSKVIFNADDVAASTRFATVTVTKREKDENGSAPRQAQPSRPTLTDEEPF